MEIITKNLSGVASRFVPRLLTQACRDPNAPFFGCFDRNWWHYKIRDFPSIILQQGGYAAHLAGQLEDFSDLRNGLDSLAAASVRFWSERALSHGAFEEYYPWEQGYPPLAFSTLSAAKLCLHGVGETSAAMPAFRAAAKQLAQRFEPRAANQQVAGLAAAACLRKIDPNLISAGDFESLAQRTLSLQHSEGWFMEYDGPDLGYLTVTLDCLWDLYDQTGDFKFLDAAGRAFAFMEWFITSPPHAAGQHNARNTDYLVPYGLTRFLAEGEDWKKRAERVLRILYNNTDSPEHFFSAVDDRYVSHYIGHSVLRAISQLQGESPRTETNSTQTVPLVREIQSNYFSGSGHWRAGQSLLVSGKKGGIFSAGSDDDTCIADFGWIVQRAKKEYVSHWWSPDWQVEARDNRISVRGKLYPHVEHLSTPAKHAILRLTSFFLGRHLIAWLKSILIFKAGGEHLSFHREIFLESAELIHVEDEIGGLLPGDKLCRAPRASKRHVASADSFHPEDFVLAQGCHISETRDQTDNVHRIKTSYQIPA